MKTIFSLLIMAILASGQVIAQNTTYTLAEGSRIIVEGTSTVHDWDIEIDNFQSVLEADASDNTISIANTSIEVKVDDMDADNRRMNRLMHGALKKDDHPEIRFTLNPAQTEVSAANNPIQVTANGTVEIAGVEQVTYVNLEGMRNGNNELRFTGSKELKMSDFDVDPPTAMLGTIRAGDDIIIHFDLLYTPAK